MIKYTTEIQTPEKPTPVTVLLFFFNDITHLRQESRLSLCSCVVVTRVLQRGSLHAMQVREKQSASRYIRWNRVKQEGSRKRCNQIASVNNTQCMSCGSN